MAGFGIGQSLLDMAVRFAHTAGACDKAKQRIFNFCALKVMCYVTAIQRHEVKLLVVSLNFPTESRGRMINAPASYTGGLGFKFRHGDRVS
jgi:hypothetical protein